MSAIEHLQSLTLDLPPSCIEFWPSDPRYAVVGTYNLETSSADRETNDVIKHEEEAVREPSGQRRNGSVILLQVEGHNVEIVDTHSTPSAILDIHFAPSYHPRSLFGVATSTGSIGLYQIARQHGDQLDDTSNGNMLPRLVFLKVLQYFPEDVLVTAFSWNPTSMAIGMTLSNGDVQVAQASEDVDKDIDALTPKYVGSHDLEAWTLSFLPNGLGLFSGGDDSVLSLWTTTGFREDGSLDGLDPSHEATMKTKWMDRRSHGAGVTAILPLRDDAAGTLVLTGSYDDHIRLLYAPAIGRRSTLAEMNLGGGVWRLKRIDSEPDLRNVVLLASCMHAGARIIRLTHGEDDEWSFEVLAKFEEHKSMNYGSDFQPYLNGKNQRAFVTTSFYDRLLCLWLY